MTFSLRKAQEHDSSRIFQLYREVMKPFIEQIWGWDLQWQQDDFAEHFEPDNILLAEVEEEMAGYIQAKPIRDALFIRMLLVAPKFQRIGIGTQLMKQVSSLAVTQSKGLQLQVFKINIFALKFYEGFGFQVTGETDNSLIMKLNSSQRN